MVEKVDRPNPPAGWTVRPSTATQERGSERRSPQQSEDEFSSPGTPEGWEKFHATHDSRQLLHVASQSIRHLWFRRAVLQRQLAILEVDMELDTGAIYRGVQFLLPRFDDYFQMKGYAIGQEIPPFVVAKDPMIQVSIPTPRTSATTTSPSLTSLPPAKWWHLWDARRQRVQPMAVLLIGAVLIVTIVLIVVSL